MFTEVTKMELTPKEHQARYEAVLRRLKETKHVTQEELAVVQRHVELYGFQSIVDKALPSNQAKVDRIMMEFCPELMTKEQYEIWGNNQVCTQEDPDFARKLGDLKIIDCDGKETTLSRF